jgi:outer membrane lipoprotein-sorting protein
VTTARGTLIHRQNTALWPKAHERYVARMNRPGRRERVSIQITGHAGGERARPDVREETIRFWSAPPDRLREEVTSNMPPHARTVVLNGELWWLYGDAIDAMTNEQLDEEERANHHAGGGEQFRPLLDPSWLIPAVEIDDVRAGDGVLHVVARPRDDVDGPRYHHLHLVGGADRFELEVDAELGIVRATTAYIDGEELSAMRFEELSLGEQLADDLFTRPTGVDFGPAGGHAAPSTLDNAAAEAPFPVFYVPELPEGVWRLQVHRIRRPKFTVWLMYHRADGRDVLTIGQSQDADLPADGEGTLAVERNGTKLLLRSETLDREKLAELAASLEPVVADRDRQPPA